MIKSLYTLLLAVIMLNSYSQAPGTKSRPAASPEKGPVTPQKIPVKVIIITMFERGNVTGDIPGEFQYWVERYPLSESIPFPQGYMDLRYNREKQVLGICTGMGTARSAASVMALGMDSRFDLSKAYWMVAGIAGIDPEDGTTGSAVWAEWLVDGDLSHEIDAREMPADWTTGFLPLGKAKPYELPLRDGDYNNMMHLNPSLMHWAYELTKNIQLPDYERLQVLRAKYNGYPEAQKPPRVMTGDHVAAMRYWHGKYQNQWANEWVKYWTGGKGNFVTSAMEDTGTAQALQFLDKAKKADFNRLLVLRTASNFTLQYPGISAAQSLTAEKKAYSAYLPALEAAYITGKVVTDSLVGNWKLYEEKTAGNNPQ